MALERTTVEESWGVGPAYSARLKSRGIETALQLRDADVRWARESMTVVGARLVMEPRGVSCLPLETAPPAKKSITTSRSFPNGVSEYGELKEFASFFVTRCAEKLRKARLAASVVTVFIQTRGLFDDRDSAERAYQSAAGSGYGKDDLSLIMSDETRQMRFSRPGPQRARLRERQDLRMKAAQFAVGRMALLGSTGYPVCRNHYRQAPSRA